jgi:multiple sugar transport system permease protein
VPTVYYEAATIDGANYIKRTLHITFPLITPVIFFNIIMSMIAAVQQFVLPFTITNGEGKPANSMLFYAMLLYRNAFSYLQMGVANAMAWMMFMLIMAFTLIMYRTSTRWVYYMGE